MMPSQRSDRRVRFRRGKGLLGLPVAALLCSLALAAPAVAASPSGKFYDASLNGGFNCFDGVAGTDGGTYGTVTIDTSTTTAEIRVWRLSPNTAYEVFLTVSGPGGCGSQHLTTLTTNQGGTTSVSLSTSNFPATGVFYLNTGSAPNYATPVITF